MHLKLFAFLSIALATTVTATELSSSAPGCSHSSSILSKNAILNESISDEKSIAVDTSFSIEAQWIGEPQWMTGVNNSYETFNGSIAKGINVYGSNLTASQYAPVEIRLNSDSSQWSKVQVFRRTGLGAVGVGTFPGSGWDMTDKNNPRRLNLCIVECYNCGELAIPDVHNGVWDPDTSQYAKFELLFVMRSDYDSTGMTYAGRNILNEDLDNLYVWWPRVATGHTFFETDTAKLSITLNVGLSLVPYDDSIIVSWVFPGADPDHFKIYYSTDSLADSFLVQLDGSTRSFKHTGLIPEQEYYYQIKSFDSTDSELYHSKTMRAKTRLFSLGIELFGQWDGRNDYGGIWGYTDSATGLEYALICSRSFGLSIVDINDTPLVEVGFVSQSLYGIGTQEVRTYGHYAVTCMDGLASGIIDLSDVTNPQVISAIPNGQHTLQIYENYVIFAGGDSPTGVEIYDISNPYDPTFVSFYSPYYYHDYAIRNDTLAAFAIYGQGIDLLDISDIFNPQPIGHFNYSGSGAHNGVFSEDGRYLFVGDEIGSGNWTRVFDISDLQNVELVSNIIVNPNEVVHNCEIIGPHLYIAHYDLGLRIWNVADPAEPYEVAFYDTGPHPNFQYTGAWGVYPYFESGKIVLSDMENGLYVFTSTLLGANCCEGIRGDANGDGDEFPDVLDLSFLVDVLYRGGSAAPCDEEADLDADGTPSTVLDLTYLVDRMFKSGPLPGMCP